MFGRNSIGGAISLVSNKPTKQFEGSLSASIGNYSERDLTGVVNIPFAGERSAMRLVVSHSEHAGYGRAILLHRALGDDDTNYVRAQLLIEPADAWTLDLSADMTKVRTSSQLVTLAAARPPATTIGNRGESERRPGSLCGSRSHGGSRQSRRQLRRFYMGRFSAADSRSGGLTLKSISAYRSLDTRAITPTSTVRHMTCGRCFGETRSSISSVRNCRRQARRRLIACSGRPALYLPRTVCWSPIHLSSAALSR